MPQQVIDVLIPAYNEEGSLPLVLRDLSQTPVRQVIVCNNGSTDRTVEVAEAAGAVVVHEPRRGYGNACLAGMRYLKSLPASEQPDIVVFLDGDYSDYPEELPKVVAPILHNGADLVIGSRLLLPLPPGAMSAPQVFGNWLSSRLIRALYGYRFTDLGPFRAIRWPVLLQLDMRDPNYGWTVEMQIKAARHRLRTREVPVRYRPRAAGKSKVSRTFRGVVLAGAKILGLTVALAFHRPVKTTISPEQNN
ncbi:MAG: glycosyltransferase family 2 protein [Saprospiraceae bacterium]|nr:glycosyltransferase family 2 protein [Saprospiraceae bacterium]